MATERRDDTDDGSGRPFPTPPRNPKQVRVFALLVGINDYQNGVPKLKGCINDVEQVERYLRSRYGGAVAAEETTNEADTTEDADETRPATTRSARLTTTRPLRVSTRIPGRVLRRSRRRPVRLSGAGQNGDADPPIDRSNDGASTESAASGLPEVEVDGRLHLMTLIDSEATYDNIIRAFENHLTNATDKDTVWFHFSGHGSEQFAAPEFDAIDPNGKDQTLVCYVPPVQAVTDGEEAAADENPPQQFLADKELAVLLNKVAKKKPHIVVSLDSCHSGSGTRDVLDEAGMKSRAYQFLVSGDREDPSLLPNSIRSIDSYLGSYSADNLEIPPAEHVLLSACESVETAGDLPQGGVFTTSLIENLNAAKKPIHYADLFVKTRAKANKRRNKQNPQFETIDGFDPYTSFLDGMPMSDIKQHYEVFRQGDKWYVRCGAIHGLPVGAKEPIKIMINGGDETAPTVGAHLESVGAQHSKIRAEDVEGLIERDASGNEIFYFAEILAMPATPVYARIEGESAGVTQLMMEWDPSKNVLLARQEVDSEMPYIAIEVTDEDSFIIRQAQTGKKFIEVPPETGSLERRIELVKQNVEKIVRWKRMIELDNPKTSIRDKFDFALEVIDKNQDSVFYQDKEVKIYVSEENLRITPRTGNGFLGINFRVTLKDTLDDLEDGLFLYGFDLSEICAIKFRNDEEKVARGENMSTGEHLPLKSKPYSWGLGPDDDGAVRYFKLLVTTEELDYHQLTQPGLIGDKDVEEEEFDPEVISDDWCAETIKVTLVREKNEIPNSSDEPVVVSGTKIRIKGHDGVTANVGLATADAGARSDDPTNKLASFSLQGHQMLNFNKSEGSRDAVQHNVLELTGLKVEDGTDLRTNPLEIILEDKLEADELLLPIAFDGDNFRVIGEATGDGDETVVKIHELPETAIDGERSLFRALKMAFFKLVLKKTDQNELCYVDYQEDGTIKRRDEGIIPKVQQANNILLLVHGIIGNTEQMAADVASIPADDGKAMKDEYDLILTYDYENLNTDIRETAAQLKADLEAAGITAAGGKKLTILAHSMGGLVTRWMIERIDGGKDLVDHLIMAGTPNNGSNFGKIEEGRRFAVKMLDVAANFAPNFIPFSGYVLKALQGAANVLITLGQMDPESEFLTELNNSPDPGIPYSVLAGDTQDYQEQGEGFSKLVERIELGIGNVANIGERHDIAVSVDSILNEVVWQTRARKGELLTVSCHHLNYFSSEQGREGLEDLLLED